MNIFPNAIKSRIYRYVVYFRRGHGSWLAYAMSFTNFIVIQYRLLIEQIPLLERILPSLTIFSITFFLVYMPTSVIIGWYDTKRATVPTETEVNPYFDRPVGKEIKVYVPVWNAILEVLEKMAEKEGLTNEIENIRQAKGLLDKWVTSKE